MTQFDREKTTQLLVGIAGVYFIYSLLGILQENTYSGFEAALRPSTGTT